MSMDTYITYMHVNWYTYAYRPIISKNLIKQNRKETNAVKGQNLEPVLAEQPGNAANAQAYAKKPGKGRA